MLISQTVLARREQFHQSRLSEHVGSWNPVLHDTLAQIHLIHGNYDASRDSLEHARESYGAYGRQASQWYDWSVRVLLARLALRRGDLVDARALADATVAAGAPAAVRADPRVRASFLGVIIDSRVKKLNP